MVLLGYQALATEFFFASIAFVFVVLRLYVRAYQQGLFNLGDAICIAAFLLMMVGIASDCVINHLGFWEDTSGMGMASMYMGAGIDPMWLDMLPIETLLKLCKIFYAQSLIYYTVLWLAKFVLLHLYYSLIPNSMRTLKMLLHFTAAFTVAGYIAAMGLPYYITLGLHLAAEAFLCIIPIPLVRVLNLDKRKKWGLAFVFGLAALCILCTVAQRTKCTNMSGVDPAMGVWAAWEEACSIMAVCAPSLKCFLTRGFLKSMRSLRSTKKTDDSATAVSDGSGGHGHKLSGNSTDITASISPEIDHGEKCPTCGQVVRKSRRISSVFEILRKPPSRSSTPGSTLWSRRGGEIVEPKAARVKVEVERDVQISSTMRSVTEKTLEGGKGPSGAEGFGLSAVTASAVTITERPVGSPLTPLDTIHTIQETSGENSERDSRDSSIFMV